MAVGHEKDANTTIHPAVNNGTVSSRLTVDIRMDEDSNSSKMSTDDGVATTVETAAGRPEHSLSPPVSTERLAEYELSSQLGDGAYGTVLLANHKRSNQTVAIKSSRGLLSSCHVTTLIKTLIPCCVMVAQAQLQLQQKFCHFGKLQPRGSLEKSRFRFVHQIGDGTYGEVFLAEAQDGRGVVRPYAIKQMKNTYLTWKDALKEMEIVVAGELKRHPNIIHMLEAFREAQQLYMVFEFMDCNLYQLMKDRSIKRFTEDETRNMTGQIFCGLQYLHEKGFFHRDLKPENILCNGTEVIKIADFGQARQIRSRPPYTEYVSTRWYRAPELVLSSKVYSLGVDIWAVGCIMAEIVTLRPLFDGATAADQLFKIVKLLGTPKREDWPQGFDMADRIKMSFPPGFERQNLSLFIKPASPLCEEVVAATLQYNPQSRPSAKSCLQMQFFSKTAAGRRSWDNATTVEKTTPFKRPSVAAPTNSNTFSSSKPRHEPSLLPKLQPQPEPNLSIRNNHSPNVQSKALPAVREIVQAPSAQILPEQPLRRRPIEPSPTNKPFNPRPTADPSKKPNLFRRHESQNIIPTVKYSAATGTTVVVKNPVQKFVAQTTEKVSKSSTSPNLVIASGGQVPSPSNGGDPSKPRFRTDQQTHLQPFKYGNAQRILGSRRESRKNLDPHQSTELGGRRLLEANRVLRKHSSGTDGVSYASSLKADLAMRGSSTSPIDEFPDPFAGTAEMSRGDRKLLAGRPMEAPEKSSVWMTTQNVPSKAHLFTTQKSSPFLIRPNAQLLKDTKGGLPPAAVGGDRKSQEPSWWDK
ncbi:Serine/threonine-protein kinase ICK [Hypsibius exemplaris]|uniref:Serine/threonine-protein kinase ICK n=1 Tax=Hypsibius exemplaris TaxID=2072580 RepID=A0A1W0XEC9_HYPEX|nr:Serine/threonine-protein kinase ICK [Hypsibius exemplaris]